MKPDEKTNEVKQELSVDEFQIIRRQVTRNSAVIDHTIRAIDFLVNKERCPKDANLLLELRRKLSVAMDENDTFRRVLWRQMRLWEAGSNDADSVSEAAHYVMSQIRRRQNSIAAQMAMK